MKFNKEAQGYIQSVNDIRGFYGKTITAIAVRKETLVIELDKEIGLEITDKDAINIGVHPIRSGVIIKNLIGNKLTKIDNFINTLGFDKKLTKLGILIGINIGINGDPLLEFCFSTCKSYLPFQGLTVRRVDIHIPF